MKIELEVKHMRRELQELQLRFSKANLFRTFKMFDNEVDDQ